MHSLLTLGLVALDMTGNLRTFGLIGGVVLLVIWWLSVKNTTALFYDKKKIRANIMFGAPGVILLLIGLYMMGSMKPESSEIYVANYTDKVGKIEVDGVSHEIASGSWEKIEVRSKEDSYAIKGYVGDSMVFDTTMGDGSWIGSLSDDRYVLAEEVVYAGSSFNADSDSLAYEMLMNPGVARFSSDIIEELYDFDNKSPETMSVSSQFGTVHKFDLQLLTQADLLKMMMDAMGSEGMEEGDSLLEEVIEEEVPSEDDADGGE